MANITFKQFTKCCSILCLCNVIKTIVRGKEDDTFLRKKTEGKQKSVTIMISVDGKKDSCSSEVEIRWGIVWIKILQNRILKNS